MDSNTVECNLVEKGDCVCKSGATLAILKDVQRAYEERMDLIERVGGAKKMEMQVCVLRSWVGDLVAQNTLLARAVEDLEQETVARVAHERRRHAEIICELRAESAALRRRLTRKDSDLRGLIEVLRRLREFDYCTLDGIHFFEVTESDIFGSIEWRADRLGQNWGDHEKDQKNNSHKKTNRLYQFMEIRRLNKDIQQYELTLTKMRKEMSEKKLCVPEVIKKDAEVMAGMCCTGTECGDLEPVKDVGELLREETSKYRERIHKMELSLKSSGVKVRAVHKINLGLLEELSTLRRLCVAVDVQRRDARLRLDLESQIVKQMLKQLRQAKAKEPCHLVTSTPDGSLEILNNETGVSIIPPQFTSPIMVSDTSMVSEIGTLTLEESNHQQICSHKCDVEISSTNRRHGPKNTSRRDKKPITLEQLVRNNLDITDESVRLCAPCIKTDTSSQAPCSKSTTLEKNQRLLEDIKKKLETPRRSPTKFETSRIQTDSSKNSAIQEELGKAGSKKLVQIKIAERSLNNNSGQREVNSVECASSSPASPQAQNSERPDGSEKGVELSFNKDGEFELKPCPCINLECMHKDDESAGRSNDDMTKAKKLVKKESFGSDFLHEQVKQDSGGGSSCAGACEQYRDKLMATLQILENKEETIRVQVSSLGVAEARIAALTERACALRCELDSKATELAQLRKFADSCRVEKSDISITADIQEVENQKHIVNTLQDNLSVIAELYRECFYETAKQEELIDLLRKSYLDVRLMEKDKSDKINRLQNVVNTQKWSIERCQDVVVEVENLKSEISSFLNSSNNDSGMWERGSESPDVGEELGDILDQLRQLQNILTGDCTCGLDEENMALKMKNENLEIKLDELRHKLNELQTKAADQEYLDEQYQQQIAEKEKEFQEIRKSLAELEFGNKERGETCETLARQLQQAQVLLSDKTAEAAAALQARAALEATVRDLQHELVQADCVISEGLRKLVEASEWKVRLEESAGRSAELERRLQRACARVSDLESCCREKDRSASMLQSQLEEAHARGAALCDESRRVTAGVRLWMRRQRALAREQEEKIKMQELMLNELQCCVEARQNHSLRSSPSETEPCCSKFIPLRVSASETPSYPRCSRTHQPVSGTETGCSRTLPLPRSLDRESEMASCLKCESNRQERRSSESEMANCSSAPVPPRRQKKRLPPCGDIRCQWRPGSSPSPRPDDIIERVEQLHAALAAGQRRWGRARR